MEEARRAVLDWCTEMGLHVYPERSSSGQGYHIWFFSTALRPYAVMRDALRAIARQAKLPVGVETYPMGASDAAGRWIPHALCVCNERERRREARVGTDLSRNR